MNSEALTLTTKFSINIHKTEQGKSHVLACDEDGFIVWEVEFRGSILKSAMSVKGTNLTVFIGKEDEIASERLTSILVFRASNGEKLATIDRKQLTNHDPQLFDIQKIANAYEQGVGWLFDLYPLHPVDGVYMYPDFPYVITVYRKSLSCRDLSGKLIWSEGTTCGIKRTSLIDGGKTLYVYSSYHEGRLDEEIDEMYFDVATGKYRYK